MHLSIARHNNNNMSTASVSSLHVLVYFAKLCLADGCLRGVAFDDRNKSLIYRYILLFIYMYQYRIEWRCRWYPTNACKISVRIYNIITLILYICARCGGINIMTMIRIAHCNTENNLLAPSNFLIKCSLFKYMRCFVVPSLLHSANDPKQMHSMSVERIKNEKGTKKKQSCQPRVFLYSIICVYMGSFFCALILVNARARTHSLNASSWAM